MKAIHYQVASPETISILQGAWRLSLLLACLGFLTRIFTILSSLLTFYIWTIPFQFTQESHASIILLFAMVTLSGSRCADSFSIDAILFRKSKEKLVMSPNYHWPIRLITLLYLSMFFASAVTKLVNSGLAWGPVTLTNVFHRFRFFYLLSGSPKVQMFLQNVDFALAYLPMKILGCGALLLELCAPLALMKGHIRLLIVASLAFMHIMIYFTMGLDFIPDLALIPFFVPWTELMDKVRQWRRAPVTE